MEVLSPLAELWYNSYHTSLGCSPFKALDGVEPKTGGTSNFALQLLCPNWWRTETCPLQSLRQHLANAHNRMKTMAAKKRSDLQFQVRDWNSSHTHQLTPKHAYKYFAPFKMSWRGWAWLLIACFSYLPAQTICCRLLYYFPVYSDLQVTKDIDDASMTPEMVLDYCRLVKKWNTAIP